MVTTGTSDTARPVLRMVAVSKSFDHVTALEPTDLDVHRGRVVALVGENGAGKSTLMKIAAGVHQQDTGHIEVSGRPTQFGSVHAAEAAGVAMIPQEIELFGDLTVAENLFVGRRRPRRLGRFDWRAMNADAADAFARLGVRIDVTMPARMMPAAVQQITLIARALIAEANVLLMDEPTAALSEAESRRLFEIIRDLTAHGVAVVYVSHRLDEVMTLADDIVVMRDGAKVHDGPRSGVDAGDVVSLMVGRRLQTLYTRSGRRIGDPVLQVRDLRRPGEFTDISFDLHAGEVLALSGLIGAGRTEIAHCVYGLRPPTSGTIAVRGRRVRLTSPRAAQRHGIGYLPEERRAQGLVVPLTVGANLSLGSLDLRTRAGFVDDVAERRLGLRYVDELKVRTSGLDALVAHLSGGNQQKVLFGKVLARDPDILILDEPTRGVDIGAKAEIYQLIDELAAAGKAVLVISSELAEVLAMADRILVVRGGRIVAKYGHDEATQERLTAAAAGAVSTTQPEVTA